MTTTDKVRPATPRFPPITLEQHRNLRCARGHQLPKDPACLLRIDNRVYCLTCESSNCRAPGETTCVNGHDLTLPNAFVSDGKCRECRRARERRYKAAKRVKAKPRDPTTLLVPSGSAVKPRYTREYLGYVVPPMEVRMNAACGPETAPLFDRVRPRESKAAAAARHQIAAQLCYDCPVFAGCAEWYRGEPTDTATVAAVRRAPAWSK